MSMTRYSKSRRPSTLLGIIALAVALALAGGCSEPMSASEQPDVGRDAPPPSLLRADQQRLMIDGLAVTLTATDTLPPDVSRSMAQPDGIALKAGYRPLYLELQVLNTTEATVTIGDQSWPVIRDRSGTVIKEPLGYSAGISSSGGPYWGHGGPPPGRPRHSDFAPGGMLTLRMPQQFPMQAQGLTLTWDLDEDLVASFDIVD